jgi:acyl-CoA reductase-like NAD-dependent aldehyde dehydrogenase
MAWQTFNPATEELLMTFEEHTPEQVNARVAEAQTVLLSRATTVEQRRLLMHRDAGNG